MRFARSEKYERIREILRNTDESVLRNKLGLRTFPRKGKQHVTNFVSICKVHFPKQSALVEKIANEKRNLNSA